MRHYSENSDELSGDNSRVNCTLFCDSTVINWLIVSNFHDSSSFFISIGQHAISGLRPEILITRFSPTSWYFYHTNKNWFTVLWYCFACSSVWTMCPGLWAQRILQVGRFDQHDERNFKIKIVRHVPLSGKTLSAGTKLQASGSYNLVVIGMMRKNCLLLSKVKMIAMTGLLLLAFLMLKTKVVSTVWKMKWDFLKNTFYCQNK
jgi:hypothetical protein